MYAIAAWIATIVVAASTFISITMLRPTAPFIFAVVITSLVALTVAITAVHRLSLDNDGEKFAIYALLLTTGCITAGCVTWMGYSYYHRENLYCLLPSVYK